MMDQGDGLAEPPRKPFCTRCGSTDIRESKSHKMIDFLLQSFSLRPFRCRSCRKRFYLRRPAEPDAAGPDEGEMERQEPADSKANP